MLIRVNEEEPGTCKGCIFRDKENRCLISDIEEFFNININTECLDIIYKREENEIYLHK